MCVPLGRAPGIRYTPSGDAIASDAVATSYKTKDKNTGEQKEPASIFVTSLPPADSQEISGY